jgi:serine/threonine protein phosphatase 1
VLRWFRDRKTRVPAWVYPPGPDDLVIYAIGDVHGRLDLLEAVHRLIDEECAAHGRKTLEIYIGDLIDRGPNSAGVINRLIARLLTHDIVCIQGNHEALLLSFLAGDTGIGPLRGYGGLETLLSYGMSPDILRGSPDEDLVRAEARKLIPEQHRAIMEAMPLHVQLGDYLFVHAGIRPGIALAAQTAQDLQWIRRAFLDFKGDLGPIVVHGHTPVPEPEFRANRIAIDTGAFATNKLTCLRIDQSGPTLVRAV